MAIPNQIIAVFAATLIVCGACGAADLPTTGPSTAPAKKSLEQQRKEAREDCEDQWRGLPAMDPTSIAQVLQFKLEHDRLLLDSPLPADALEHMIPLTDMPGNAIFRSVRSRLGLKFISFESYDFSDPAVLARHLQVLLEPLNLQVVYDVDYGDDRTHSVTLIQKTNPRAADQVTLLVQTTPGAGSEPAANLTITAASFTLLRGEHPAVFEQYVRPAFRALRQDPTVFGVDERVAWQVLSDTWKPSGDIAPKVTAILAQLNADDYSTRAAAEKQLEDLGEPAALYLMSFDRGTLTPEQKARCDKFLAGYRPLPDQQAREFGANVNFLLDCLYSDDAAIRRGALDHLAKVVGHEVKFDADQSPGDRITAIRTLREQLAPAAGMSHAGK